MDSQTLDILTTPNGTIFHLGSGIPTAAEMLERFEIHPFEEEAAIDREENNETRQKAIESIVSKDNTNYGQICKAARKANTTNDTRSNFIELRRVIDGNLIIAVRRSWPLIRFTLYERDFEAVKDEAARKLLVEHYTSALFGYNVRIIAVPSGWQFVIGPSTPNNNHLWEDDN